SSSPGSPLPSPRCGTSHCARAYDGFVGSLTESASWLLSAQSCGGRSNAALIVPVEVLTQCGDLRSRRLLTAPQQRVADRRGLRCAQDHAAEPRPKGLR